MAINIDDIIEVVVRGTKTGARTYSNLFHYRIATIVPPTVLDTVQVGEEFRRRWRDGTGGDPAIMSFFANATAIGGFTVRKIIGLGPDPGSDGKYAYSDSVFVTLQFQPGPAGSALPSGAAIRVEKTTSSLLRNFQGRIHLGSIPEDNTVPAGDLVEPAILTGLTIATTNLITLAAPPVGPLWTASMVVLSRTHWVRFGGPIEDHYEPVLTFSPRAIAGTMRRRTPPN